MVDRSFTNPAAMLHSPDVRLTGIVTRVITGRDGFDHRVLEPKRAMLFFALRGDFRLDIDDGAGGLRVPQGATVGFQVGRAHRWTGVPGPRAGDPPAFELFESSIDRRSALLQGLDDEAIVVPPDAEPHATIIRHAVAIHLAEFNTRASPDDEVIVSRCAEIILAQLIRYARSVIVDDGQVAAGIAHDEYLLRAWSAYFADPRRRWTVQALADVAGLGRTAFAQRFRKAVGVPPLTALTDIRLEQASRLLGDDKAPLIEIAFTVGYSSEAAFVRAFHRKYGMPPGRFRQRRMAGSSAPPPPDQPP